MFHDPTANQRGFALVEGVLILVIVAAIVGVGFFVWKQRKPATHASTTTTSTVSQVAPAAVGTTAAVQQVLDQENTNEQKADSTATNGISDSNKSADSTTNSIGDSYNENAY